MKQEELPYYTHKGVKGLILECDNHKVKGINPILSASGWVFLSMEQLKGIDITDEDAKVSYDDSYEGYGGCCEIVDEDIRNYENEQKIENELVREDYYMKDYAERMLLVETDGFYDWTSYYTEMKEKIYDKFKEFMYVGVEDIREIEDEWEEMCKEAKIEMLGEFSKWPYDLPFEEHNSHGLFCRILTDVEKYLSDRKCRIIRKYMNKDVTFYKDERELFNALSEFVDKENPIDQYSFFIHACDHNPEAILFSFEYDGIESCCLRYKDGTVLTPDDWQAPEYPIHFDEIGDYKWIDSQKRQAVMLNGMPRILK